MTPMLNNGPKRRWVCSAGAVVALLLALLPALAGCFRSQEQSAPPPQALTRAAVSADDGMILLDYPGPKGQLHRRDGTIEYYCDTRGLLELLRDPARSQGVVGAYVQAFDGRDWKSYTDGWVAVGEPYFVIDSDRLGAMGPTIVPFRERAAAEAFAAAHGGSIERYEALTAARLAAFARTVSERFRQGAAGEVMGHGSMQKQAGGMSGAGAPAKAP